MKLKTLLNEMGFIGLVSKPGFVNNPPATTNRPKTSIKEDDDFINPGNPASAQAKKDDYDYDARPPHMRGNDEEEDTERITAIYNEGSELLDDVGTQIEMFSEQLAENLENLYNQSGDMSYKQHAGTTKKYFNNILRNIELTQKHLKSFN